MYSVHSITVREVSVLVAMLADLFDQEFEEVNTLLWSVRALHTVADYFA